MEAGCDSHARPLLCFTAGPADATGKDSGKAPAPASGPDAGDQSEYLPVPLPRGARGACSPADYRGSGQDLRHAGRFANVYAQTRKVLNAIVIPTEAVVPELGVDKVFLYRNGTAQPVQIETGLRTDAQVEVVSGLQTGDTLITSGTLQLRTGLQVKLDRID